MQALAGRPRFLCCAVPAWVESNVAANEKGYRRSASEAELAQLRISEPKEFGCIVFGVEDFAGHHANRRIQPRRLSFKTPEHSAAFLCCRTIPRWWRIRQARHNTRRRAWIMMVQRCEPNAPVRQHCRRGA